MGTQTSGKASVQTVLPLGDGTAIKLTAARYCTPNGRAILARGRVPDIALDDGSRSDSNLQVREARSEGRPSFRHSLPRHFLHFLDMLRFRLRRNGFRLRRPGGARLDELVRAVTHLAALFLRQLFLLDGVCRKPGNRTQG